jgi:hypothetical protein
LADSISVELVSIVVILHHASRITHHVLVVSASTASRITPATMISA